MHYLYQSTVVEGEREHEVYLRLRHQALNTYDDIIMSKSWYSYPKHSSPIAYFSFTRDSDHDPHFEHQISRGSWEGRHKKQEEVLLGMGALADADNEAERYSV